MPQVKVCHSYDAKKKSVYAAVKDYLDHRETLQKLGATISWSDSKCSGEIEADSFTGSISIDESDAGTEVSIVIDLPLLMSPFKGKVQEELKKHLGRVKV